MDSRLVLSTFSFDARRLLLLLYATVDEAGKAVIVELVTRRIQASEEYRKLQETKSFVFFDEEGVRFQQKVQMLLREVEVVRELPAAFQLAQTVASIARTWDERVAAMHTQLKQVTVQVSMLRASEQAALMQERCEQVQNLYEDMQKFLVAEDREKYAPPQFTSYNQVVGHLVKLQQAPLQTPMMTASVEGHSYANGNIAMDAQDDTIVAGFRDVRKVKSWKIRRSGKHLRAFRIWEDPNLGTQAILAMPWGCVSLCTDGKTIRVWGQWSVRPKTVVHGKQIVRMVRAGHNWVTAAQDGTLAIWSRGTVQPNALDKAQDAIDGLSANARMIAVHRRGQPLISLFDIQRRTAIRQLHVDIKQVQQMGIHEEQLWVLAEGTCLIWDLDTDAYRRIHIHFIDGISCSLLSEGYLLAGDVNGFIHIFGLRSGCLLQSISAHARMIRKIALVDGGFVSAGDDGMIQIWKWKP